MKAPVLKTGVGVTPSRVRISPSPPLKNASARYSALAFFNCEEVKEESSSEAGVRQKYQEGIFGSRRPSEHEASVAISPSPPSLYRSYYEKYRN